MSTSFPAIVYMSFNVLVLVPDTFSTSSAILCSFTHFRFLGSETWTFSSVAVNSVVEILENLMVR